MLSIPEIASQQFGSLESQDLTPRTLIFFGEKSVGKSTLVNLFLDKNDQVRETLILEYSFGRKSNQKSSLDKSVCHVWEYGGNLDMLKTVLATVPVKGNVSCCIMIDLSKIRRMWNTLEMAMDAAKGIQPKNGDIEIIIIGAKYDIYKNYDTELKKQLSNTLRSVALIHGCSLFYYSSKDPAAVKRAKEILQAVAFGAGFPTRDKATGLSKPLLIPKGTDSWENIGFGTKQSTFEEVKARHLSILPLESDTNVNASSTPGPPAAHAEPAIDAVVESKFKDLRQLASFDLSMTYYFHEIS